MDAPHRRNRASQRPSARCVEIYCAAVFELGSGSGEAAELSAEKQDRRSVVWDNSLPAQRSAYCIHALGG